MTETRKPRFRLVPALRGRSGRFPALPYPPLQWKTVYRIVTNYVILVSVTSPSLHLRLTYFRV